MLLPLETAMAVAVLERRKARSTILNLRLEDRAGALHG